MISEIVSGIVSVVGWIMMAGGGWWAAKIHTRWRATMGDGRCSWCGGKRSKPQRPVCDMCLERVHTNMAAPNDWPREDDAA